MAKIKVHEIAKEFDIKSSEVIEVLAKMGVEGKTASSGLEDDQAEAVRKKLSGKGAKEAPAKEAPAKEAPAKEATAKAAPAKEAAAKTVSEKSADDAEGKPVKKLVKKAAPADGAPAGAPLKKKKPIIVVSSSRNAQVINRGGAPAQRGAAPVRPGQRSGIIKPTVPTTAERAARYAENNQALCLKKKIQRMIKLISILLGSIAVALAVLLEVLERRDNLKPAKQQDLLPKGQDSLPQHPRSAPQSPNEEAES